MILGGWNRGLSHSTNVILMRWSEERRGLHYSPRTEICKGQRLSPSTEFKPGEPPWNKRGKFIPNLRPSVSLAYILGVLYGDGWTSGTNGRYQVGLSVVDRVFADEFARALQCIGVRPVRLKTKARGNRQEQVTVVGCNRYLYHWIQNRTLKDLEFTALKDLENASAFLRGFYDSDGSCARERYFNFTNTDESLIHLAWRLLSRLGIVARILGPYSNGPWKPFWRLNIPASSGGRFVEVVGPTIKRGLLGGGASCE